MANKKPVIQTLGTGRVLPFFELETPDILVNYEGKAYLLEGESGGGAGVDTTAIHDNVASEISAITEKTVPIDTDLLVIEDAANSYNKKKLQIGNLPKNDPYAIHDNISAEISLLTEKTVPLDADWLIIEDTADTNSKKKIQIGNISGLSPLTTKGDLFTFGTDDARLAKGTDGYGLIADSTQTLGIKWGVVLDPYAIHTNVAAEISTITEDTEPLGNSVFVMEDYGESASYGKRRVKLSTIRTDCDAISIYGNSIHIEADTPATGDVLKWDSTAWRLASGVAPLSHASTHELAGGDVIAHQNLSGAGTNTHATIDLHLGSTANPHSVTYTQAGAAAAGHTHTDLHAHSNKSELDLVSDGDHDVRTDNPHGVDKTDVGLSNVENTKVNLSAVVNPTVTDDTTAGYSAGSRWVNLENTTEFVCVDAATGAAGWLETTDEDTVHTTVSGEIYGVTLKGTPVDGDVLLIEDVANSYNKKRITLGSISSGGTLDRLLVFADDTEFEEADTTYDTKKTFRIIRDSAKKPTSWRLVLTLWIAGGGTSADCELTVIGTGVEDAASVSSTATSENSASVKKIDLVIDEDNEPEDNVLTVDIDLKQTGGGTAHLKYTDLYAIFT